MMRNDKFNISLLSGLTRIFTPTSKRLTSLFYQEKESEQTHVVLIYLIFPFKLTTEVNDNML